MTGEFLKKVLKKDKVTIPELAEKMGISYQLLYAFLSREDLKTSLIEKIAIATDKSPLYYYSGGIIEGSENRIQELEQEVAKLQKIINALTQ